MIRKLLFALLLIVAIVEALALGWLVFWPQGPRPQGVPTPPPKGLGWIDLLDEQHAAGWENISDDKDIFEINDGVLHIHGTLGWLRYVGYTSEQFGDFDLHIEFKVTPHANSGVFLRSQRDDPVYRGFEVQVLADHGRRPSKNSCGSIYDVATPMFNMSRPAGQWNSYDITLQGQEVIVRMNGWMILHVDLSQMTMPIGKFKGPFAGLPLEGLICLQDHGHEVWYRNIIIRKRKPGVLSNLVEKVADEVVEQVEGLMDRR